MRSTNRHCSVQYSSFFQSSLITFRNSQFDFPVFASVPNCMPIGPWFPTDTSTKKHYALLVLCGIVLFRQRIISYLSAAEMSGRSPIAREWSGNGSSWMEIQASTANEFLDPYSASLFWRKLVIGGISSAHGQSNRAQNSKNGVQWFAVGSKTQKWARDTDPNQENYCG